MAVGIPKVHWYGVEGDYNVMVCCVCAAVLCTNAPTGD